MIVEPIPPILRSPYGLFLKPLTPCHTAPPIACAKVHQLWDVTQRDSKHLHPYKKHLRSLIMLPMGRDRESDLSRGLSLPWRKVDEV